MSTLVNQLNTALMEQGRRSVILASRPFFSSSLHSLGNFGTVVSTMRRIPLGNALPSYCGKPVGIVYGCLDDTKLFIFKAGSFSTRWKHKSAKIGLHLQNLNEMAHENVRQEADEKRRKKKEKNAVRKNKSDESGREDVSKRADSIETADQSSGEDTSSNDSFEEDDDVDDEHNVEGVLPVPANVRERMMKQVRQFEEYLKTVRGGEPTPELFDNIFVNAYGDPNTPLQAVAQIVLVSHTLATATCFDPALGKAVATAVRNKLSLNPSVDEGGIVQIPIPRVSLESRQTTSAQVKKRAEVFRQRIRGVRRKALDIVKQGVAGKLEHVSKDDAFRVQKDIESMADDIIQKINVAADKKHEDIMVV
jgi:ribosome recycling factor